MTLRNINQSLDEALIKQIAVGIDKQEVTNRSKMDGGGPSNRIPYSSMSTSFMRHEGGTMRFREG